MNLPGASIRTKLALATTFLVALISIVIFLYFPGRLETQSSQALTNEAYNIAQITADTVAAALAEERDPLPRTYAALAALQENKEVVYVVVADPGGRTLAGFGHQLAEEVSFRTLRMEKRARVDRRGKMVESKAWGGFTPDGRIFQTRVPLLYRGRTVGSLYAGTATDRLLQQVRESQRLVGLVSVGIFVIGVFIALFISGAISRPLRAMVRTTKEIAAGNLAERATVTGRDEVAQLARSFNVMVERLSAAQDDLASMNRTLEQRVDERTRELRGEVTERRRAERRYRALFERNLAGVYIARTNGTILECNDACARMLGYDSGERLIEGGGAIQYFDAAEHRQAIDELMDKGSVVNHEAQLLRRDGDVVWVLQTLGISNTDQGEAIIEGIVLDITDRKRTEQEVEFQAYHDSLTGLPNRMLFMDRLGVAVSQARRRQQPLSVMFLDLDDLKVVNDTLGHSAGDHLLQLVAERLVTCLRQEDTVARIGGDEFTLLLPPPITQGEATTVAKKVLTAIQKPFVIGEDEIRLTTSIGIAVYPTDGEDPDTLLANADGTMYRVKEAGGASYQFCSHTLARRTLGRMTMEDSLKEALERNEFLIHYQPQVDSATREVVAMEALIRWKHPDIGMIAPGNFISLAEYTGLIIPIGEWVLRQACRQTKEWAEGGMPLRVGVNVSGRQFHQRDFVGMIDRALRDTGLDPKYLELEITETMAMQKSERTIAILNEVRAHGIGIALDDFGTGQSSLTYLKRFPITTVKIDRSFISGISGAMNDAPIVDAVLHLASSLGLRTVAEGVETAEQWDFLASRGCVEMQGYYISRPVDAASFSLFARQPAATRAFGNAQVASTEPSPPLAG
jgi:diguanylate cyclase (GGDEF)-like protein/PAS domain S-box-containing protein